MSRLENPKAIEAIRNDFLVLAWSSVGLTAMFGLCALIGLKAVGIALVLAALGAWKANYSSHKASPVFWRGCWFVLLLADLVLAIAENVRY